MNIDKSDEDRGLYTKYKVTRTDGRSRKGQRHEGCSYYVLDLDHDPYSIAALEAYSDSCAETFPALSDDIKRKVHEKGPKLARLLQEQLGPAHMVDFIPTGPRREIEFDTLQLESNERGPRPDTIILNLAKQALASLEAGLITPDEVRNTVVDCLTQIRDIADDADARTGRQEKSLDA